MSTSDSIYLGLGCFHFSIRKPSGVPLSGTQYLDEVRVALERLPEVENVSIHVDDEFGRQRIPLKCFSAGDASLIALAVKTCKE